MVVKHPNIAPSLDEFEDMAHATLRELPAPFATRLGRLVVRVADLAAPEVLAELGIDNPYELTGLYEGVTLPMQSSSDLPSVPATVWLYRRAIINEWSQRGDVDLDKLITHVLVHEIAHHFGFTDDEIAAIDDWRL